MSDDEDLDHETLGKKVTEGREYQYDHILKAIEELPAEKLNEYRDIFSFFDRDGGGSIGAEEFDQVMRTFGWEPTEEELKVSTRVELDFVTILNKIEISNLNQSARFLT